MKRCILYFFYFLLSLSSLFANNAAPSKRLNRSIENVESRLKIQHHAIFNAYENLNNPLPNLNLNLATNYSVEWTQTFYYKKSKFFLNIGSGLVVKNQALTALLEKTQFFESDFALYKIVITEKGYNKAISFIELQRRYKGDFRKSQYRINEVVFPEETGYFEIDKKEGPAILKYKTLESKEKTNSDFLLLASYLVVIILLILSIFLSLKHNENYGAVLLGVAFTIQIINLNFSSHDSSDLFFIDSSIYASSKITPSLLDLLVLLLIIWALLFYLRNRTGSIRKLSPLLNLILVVLLLTFCSSFLVTLSKSLIADVRYELDFLNATNIDIRVVLIFLLIILGAVIHIYWIWWLMRVSNFQRQKIRVIIAVSIVSFVGIYLSDGFPIFLIPFFAYVLLALFFKDLSRSTQQEIRKFSVLFSICLIASFICAWSAIKAQNRKLVDMANLNASQFLLYEDPLGRYLILNQKEDLKNSNLLGQVWSNPYQSEKILEKLIRDKFSNPYLKQYRLNVEFATPGSRALYAQGAKFTNLLNSENIAELDSKGLIRVNTFNNSKPVNAYICKLPITLKGKEILTAYLIFESLNDELIERNLLFPKDNRQFNSDYKIQYALYRNKRKVGQVGQFTFPTSFEVLDRSEGLYKIITLSDAKTVVIKLDQLKRDDLISYAGLFFLILSFLVVLYLILKALYAVVGSQPVSFTTQISLMVNLAYFIPLIAASILIISIVGSTVKEDIKSQYISKSENIARSLTDPENGLFNYGITAGSLNDLSRIENTDIHFYDASGYLKFSSRPSLFSSGIKGKQMDPLSYYRLSSENFETDFSRHNIWDFKYRYVSAAVKSIQGIIIGYVSIPFFDSGRDLALRVREFLKTTTKVYAGISVIFLVFTLMISSTLLKPLYKLAEVLKQTKLGEQKKIQWRSDNELGYLIKNYNNMIDNLENSRKELSKKEKESAWRDVARQVAHEIKNPLTPMKLKLQLLIQKSAGSDDAFRKEVNKTASNIVEHVDTIGNIATSFSDYAKMPVPVKEKFDLKRVLQESISLFSSENQGISLSDDIEPVDMWSEGDEKLMLRIFNNIILNANHSIQGKDTGQINVRAYTDEGRIKIEIQDNGSGIPSEIQEKVFLPNFTTKSEGSGIGLALAKRGVEHAGGSISFKTISGQGTTFFLEMPLSNPQ